MYKRQLQNPTPVRSKLIWRLLLADSSCIRGVVESSTRQSFENPNREGVISATGRLLMDAAWLPACGGAYVKPCDISLDELPPGFERASLEARGLGEKLGMKKSEEQEAIAVLARGDVRKRKVAEYLMNASDDVIEKFEKLIPKQRELPEFKSFKEGVQSLHRLATGNPIDGGGGPAPVSNPDRYRSCLLYTSTSGVCFESACSGRRSVAAKKSSAISHAKSAVSPKTFS